jgi:hypothetical protein
MSAAPLNDVANRILESSNKKEYLEENDPYSRIKMTRENSVGKDGIGIFANGLKAAGTVH